MSSQTLNPVRPAVCSLLLSQVQHFVNHKLGLSERQLQTVTWPEVARRIVQVRASRNCMPHNVGQGVRQPRRGWMPKEAARLPC